MIKEKICLKIIGKTKRQMKTFILVDFPVILQCACTCLIHIMYGFISSVFLCKIDVHICIFCNVHNRRQFLQKVKQSLLSNIA